MATIQEIQAAAKLKREQNLTPAQAVEQVRTSATPVTPPTQNFPSQPINQQTVQGVNWQTFQVAPINQQGVTPQTQPTPAPTQPAPVTPTPTTPTPTAPVDEAAKIKAQNEAQMELNKQKSQLAIQERKQQEADAKMANTPTDQKSILTSLVSGVSVPEQKTAAYRNAQTQYKNYQKFNSMTPTQLLDNMKMGEIDTATSQLLASNPNYIKAKEDFDKFQKNQSINQMVKSVTNGATGKTEEVDYAEKASSDLARKLGIDQTNQEAYATIVSQNPEVVNLTKTVSSITRQLNTLNTERNAVYEDLKSQYPTLSASGIMTLMASRTKQATDQIDALNSSLTLTTADLKTALEMAKWEYEATSQDIALQAGIAKEDRAMKNALTLDQKQFEQDIAQQAEQMRTPELAIPAMIDEYKKLGIPFTRSTQQVIADFKTSGKDLGTYLSDLQWLIQSKPEYQKIRSLQMGQLSDAQKMSMWYAQDISKMKMEQNFQMALAQAKQTTNAKWTKLDDGLYTNENGDIITWDELKAAKLMWNSYITKQVWEEWGDCGFYASRGTWMTATPWGNSKDARVQAFSDATPQVGGMALFTWSWYDQTYGHISIVTGVNQDGTINVKESNYGNDKKVTERTVPASSVTGYYNDTPLAKWAGTQGTYTATEEAWANNIMNKTAKISDITNKDNVDKWRVLQLINEKSGGSTWAMQTNLQSGLEIVNSLINHPWFTDVVWVPSIFVNPLGYSLPWTSARDFKAELQRMEAIGFLNMIPQMQGMGALSNAEGSRLAAAYSKLSNTGISEKEYKEELKRLKDGMESALSKMWVQVPETPKTEVKQTVGGEKSYSKYE